MKFLSFVRKNRVIVTLFFVIFCLFLSSTIAYSALNSTMRISGSSYARVESNVRITDFYVSSGDGNVSYTAFSKDSVSSNVSGSVTFAVEITNYSSNFVGIKNISSSTDEVSYTIDNYNLEDRLCDDSGRCNNFSASIIYITVSGNNADFTLSLEFCDVYSVLYENFEYDDYPLYISNGATLNIDLSLENFDEVYLEIDGNKYDNYSLSNNKLIIYDVFGNIRVKLLSYFHIESGNLDTVGSVVRIKNEEFYVIDSDEENVTLFAKYNLYVGNLYDGKLSTEYGDSATGIQDPLMRGWVSDTQVRHGVKKFADEVYWAQDDLDYPAYVFDSRSYSYEFVSNYWNYLENIGGNINETRLITHDELLNLGCSRSEHTCLNSSYDWVYYTSYHTAVASSNTSLFVVFSDGRYSVNQPYYQNGTRVVIGISKNEFFNITYTGISGSYQEYIGYGDNLSVDFSTNAPANVSVLVEGVEYDNFDYSNGILNVYDVCGNVEIKLKEYPTIVSGDINTLGSEVEIAGEYFNIIGIDDDEVRLFAKYNLMVGKMYDTTNSEYIDMVETGIQDSSAIGHNTNISMRVGVLAFADTNYWSDTVTSYPAEVYNSNSLLYPYVENYKKYLEDKGASIINARLITNDEKKVFGCVNSTSKCLEQYSFMYNSSYWTGTAHSGSAIYYTNSDNSSSNSYYYNAHLRGVRPVIEVSLSEFKNA